MSKKTISYGALALVLSCSGLTFQSALAQDDETIEEVVTIGSRSAKPRSASDSTVPIDVISGDDFSALGGTADLTDNLKSLVPSYTATPATGDGSAFVRPTSLRGTAPDQTLVLVNGKRRHRSALVQFFAPAAGNGSHGVDIGMIPGIAVKSVEVLRDGAASQYGSDAIAGVINFVMKDASDGGAVEVTYGEHKEGEQSIRVAANGGFALGDLGFVNASFETIDNDALSRGIQREATYNNLIAGGVNPDIIGTDTPFGDAPLLQTWGRPETSGTRVFINSGFDLSDSAELYVRFGAAETDGRYRFFYRTPDHSSLAGHRANGYLGLPAGFTPYLDGSQKDASFSAGVTGEFDSGIIYDFSYGFGKNELDYFLNNTVNPALDLVGGEIPQMDFDVGGYTQEENNFNADFSLPISDAVSLSFGAEAREEKYTVIAGEPNASLGAGSSGFRGITSQDAGDYTRDNIAVYADVEHDVSDELLMQYAIRYENFSDFGPTTNAKLAMRYRFTDTFAFRGAVSSGFHAPTPGQANVRTTITTFDGLTGLQVEEGLISPTDPRALALGGAPLSEEKSVNGSLGFTGDISDNWSITADAYLIAVSDRIYRTGDKNYVDPDGILPDQTVSFYTNAIDVEHTGVDVIVNGGFDFGGAASTDMTFAYGYNKIEVTGQDEIGGEVPVSASLVEDIENNYPNHRFSLTANTFFNDKANLLLRANYYGKHYDERGTIGAAVNPSAEINSTVYFDAEFGYQLTDNFRLALGGSNIFDEYIDEIGAPNANRLSVGLQYPRRSAANYEGASYYLRGTLSW